MALAASSRAETTAASVPQRESRRSDSLSRGPRCRERCRGSARTDRTGFPARLVAQAGRREKSDRARKHRRLIGEDVTEHVLVTMTSNSPGLLIRCMAIASTSTCCTSTPGNSLGDLVHDLAPQSRRLQHVRLVDTGHSPRRERQVRTQPHHALDLVFAVDQRIDGGATAVVCPASRRLSK